MLFLVLPLHHSYSRSDHASEFSLLRQVRFSLNSLWIEAKGTTLRGK
jgi:hypothetical protein